MFAAYAHVRGCLVGLGYDPDAPPSEDVFVESFGSREGGWFPYDGLSQQLEVEEQCPPRVE